MIPCDHNDHKTWLLSYQNWKNCNIDTYTTIKIICINDNEKLLPLIRKIKNEHDLLRESGARR